MVMMMMIMTMVLMIMIMMMVLRIMIMMRTMISSKMMIMMMTTTMMTEKQLFQNGIRRLDFIAFKFNSRKSFEFVERFGIVKNSNYTLGPQSATDETSTIFFNVIAFGSAKWRRRCGDDVAMMLW